MAALLARCVNSASNNSSAHNWPQLEMCVGFFFFSFLNPAHAGLF